MSQDVCHSKTVPCKRALLHSVTALRKQGELCPCQLQQHPAGQRFKPGLARALQQAERSKLTHRQCIYTSCDQTSPQNARCQDAHGHAQARRQHQDVQGCGDVGRRCAHLVSRGGGRQAAAAAAASRAGMTDVAVIGEGSVCRPALGHLPLEIREKKEEGEGGAWLGARTVERVKQ
jgi:hypothetical protein